MLSFDFNLLYRLSLSVIFNQMIFFLTKQIVRINMR